MAYVDFCESDCVVNKSNYRNGQLCLKLVTADTERNRENNEFPGEPIATATICLDLKFEEGETVIKDNNENEGLLKALLQAGIVSLTGNTIRFGRATYPIVKVND